MPSLAQQFEPGAVSLTIFGSLDGYAVVRDRLVTADGHIIDPGIVVAGPFFPIAAAEAARRELMAHRAFAVLRLKHALSTPQPEA